MFPESTHSCWKMVKGSIFMLGKINLCRVQGGGEGKYFELYIARKEEKLTGQRILCG